MANLKDTYHEYNDRIRINHSWVLHSDPPLGPSAIHIPWFPLWSISFPDPYIRITTLRSIAFQMQGSVRFDPYPYFGALPYIEFMNIFCLVLLSSKWHDLKDYIIWYILYLSLPWCPSLPSMTLSLRFDPDGLLSHSDRIIHSRSSQDLIASVGKDIFRHLSCSFILFGWIDISPLARALGALWNTLRALRWSPKEQNASLPWRHVE